MMKNKTATRYFSNRQEKHIAKELGGRKTANSGATAFSKGDVSLDSWLIEAKTKTTPSKSITIQKEWLEKNAEEAFAMQKQYNALAFSFGEIHNDKQYYIIDEETFKHFLNLEAEYVKTEN